MAMVQSVDVPGHLVHDVRCRDLEMSLAAAVEIAVRIVSNVEESIVLLPYWTGH